MKNKVLVIDNYDSFTYNLVHYMEDLDFDVTVVRNDEFSMDFVENFDKILISPGPGIPDEAGQTKELIKRFYSKKSIRRILNLKDFNHTLSTLGLKTTTSDDLPLRETSPTLTK